MNNMMSPEMMKMAMEQMSRMTPQQMADMQRQMASLPPGFMQQQMAAMNSMDPAELQRRMRDADMHAPPGQTQGSLARSPHSTQEALKDEGNTLFSSGRFVEAVAKYENVKSELAGKTSPEAAALRQKCTLNLASCYLKLQEHDKCVQQCSEVLQSNPEDRKALYRRGQSYSALKKYPAAVSDLKAALERSPAEEKAVVTEKLDQAQMGLLKSRGSEPASSLDGSGSRQETDSSIAPTVEEIPGPSIAEPVPRVIDSSAPSQSPAPSSMPSPGMPAEGMQQTLQMMHENPALMDQMRNTFASMSPEQMQAAARMAGMPEGPGFDPQAMRQAADMMANMNPEALEQMTSMAASRHTGVQPQQQTMAPLNTPVAPAGSHQPMDAMQANQDMMVQAMGNPDMMKQAMGMMGQMDPDQMASMMASMQSGSANGQPDPSAMAGLLSDPKSREMMQQMISNIDPQQLAAISKAAGQNLTPEQSLKMMRQMMSSMDTPRLAAMSEAPGQNLTPEQAEMMSAKMRNMSDAQMEKLLTTMSWLQSAYSAMQKMRQKMAENRLLCLAVAFLLLALLLQWLGFV